MSSQVRVMVMVMIHKPCILCIEAIFSDGIASSAHNPLNPPEKNAQTLLFTKHPDFY